MLMQSPCLAPQVNMCGFMTWRAKAKGLGNGPDFIKYDCCEISAGPNESLLFLALKPLGNSKGRKTSAENNRLANCDKSAYI